MTNGLTGTNFINHPGEIFKHPLFFFYHFFDHHILQ